MSGDFYGLPIITLENAYLRLDALAQAGPRLVRAFIHGVSENLFAELPGLKIDTPLGPFSMQGGHRFWHSPEAMPRTYTPDDAGVTATESEGVLTLAGPTDSYTGLRKTIQVKLMPDRAGAEIMHTLTNNGPWTVELACWAITQLPLGGMAVLPQSAPPADPHSLLPNRNLVLWPYSRWSDERLRLHDDLLLIRGESAVPPLKIAYANSRGWLGYLRKGVFFLKRFQFIPKRPYPDLGASCAVYVNHLFLETETMGPLLRLDPGVTAQHAETWEFFNGLEDIPYTLAGARSLVRQLELE